MTAPNGFPNLTTAGQGLFASPSSVGMVQGQADPDPATRFALRSGVVSQAETTPMFGGIAVAADISPIATNGPVQPLGQVLKRSTSLATINGFTTFDQAYNMVNNPASPVPTAGSGQSINYYPLGSRARLAVQCDPSLISLRAGQINQQVSWDFTLNMLVPYASPYAATTITGATWANTSGGETTFATSTDITADLSAGDDIEVTGVISTGGTGAGYNGQFTVLSVSTDSIVVSQPSTGSPGTYSSGGTITAGGGALEVTVLDVQPSNCIVVEDVNGNFVYNYNGACAKIQLTGGTVS